MDLPDFDETARALETKLNMDEMAESHGLLCGLFSAWPNLEWGQFKIACKARELPAEFDDESSSVMQALLESSRIQLNDPDLAVGLWLPGDDEPLPVRTAALAAWCSGYLTGLTESCGPCLMQVSDDVTEVVTDLGEISQAIATADSEDEVEESAFEEIVEFVRVAILLVQEELRGPLDNDSVH